jgi:hypothetical protein
LFCLFKSAIKNLLLNQTCYSINEYPEWSVKSNYNPHNVYLFTLMSGEIVFISAYECVTHLLHCYFIYEVLFYHMDMLLTIYSYVLTKLCFEQLFLIVSFKYSALFLGLW